MYDPIHRIRPKLSHGSRGRASVRMEILVLRLKLGGDVTSAALRGLELRFSVH
jgi:hypothetical protein